MKFKWKLESLKDDFRSRCLFVATFWVLTLVCWLLIVAAFRGDVQDELKSVGKTLAHLADAKLLLIQIFAALVALAGILLLAAVCDTDARVAIRVATAELLSVCLTFAMVFLLAAFASGITASVAPDRSSPLRTMVAQAGAGLFNLFLGYALWRTRKREHDEQPHEREHEHTKEPRE